MPRFDTEREGQIDFYNRFLPRIDSERTIEDVLGDNNDGVLNGNLLEFKLRITDLNAVLFQSIKYLSALRIKGKPVPAGIHLIDLNAGKDYYYKSEPYLEYIEKVYYGAASRENTGFMGGDVDAVLNYGRNNVDAEKVITLLKENNYTKIHIDENCIVGWATRFYKIVPNARKEDFIGDETGVHTTAGEIRSPHHFEKYIYPYIGRTNEKFKYLMDKLNDTIQKKNLGAFYTHPKYAEKSLELLRKAIAMVPEGNDYIILDRCAGTGNLEAKLTDEELSHCIVSTVEYYEYKVLQELFGSKVRSIIPPVETRDTFNAGLVTGADALSREYVENPVIREYVDNPHCTIILFENPPYAETTSIEHQRRGVGAASSSWKNSYVVNEMRREVKGTAINDLGNVFIWSAFKYYLRQETDSYVVYSPVKYWKAQHLINKKFIDGFAFNRKHFHTNIDACIMCALWVNTEKNLKIISLKAFDIDATGNLVSQGTLYVEKIYSLYSKRYYDRRVFSDASEDGILIGLNGLEAAPNVQRRIKPMYGNDMLGYLVADSVGFDNPDAKSSLLVAGRYNGNGFYLHKDNYLEKLPMFAASRYITYNSAWTERARIMKSADGADKFRRDVANGELKQFLLKCLLFTCVEMQNHMRSLHGSDGRYYRNELCLDGTHGKTLALEDLRYLEKGEKEKKILKQWKNLLKLAKETEEYQSDLTYGVYQICDEIDTSYKDKETNQTVYNHIELHSARETLKTLVKDYYLTEIVPVLFKYEFLK